MSPPADARRRALLHFRACLIVLCLYYAEFIKTTILSAIESEYPPPPSKRGRTRIREALDVLLRDGALVREERDELLRLIQYRNDVAHRIHLAAAGHGASGDLNLGLVEELDPGEALSLERLKFYAGCIVERLGARYRVPFDPASFVFEKTRNAYEVELTLLAVEIART